MSDITRMESARSSMAALLLNEKCSDHVILPQYAATAPFVREFGTTETIKELEEFEQRQPRLTFDRPI